jgi:hypothetical protein
MNRGEEKPVAMPDCGSSQGGSWPLRLAAMIAREPEQRIVQEGWPVGHYIGREAELVVGVFVRLVDRVSGKASHGLGTGVHWARIC